MVSVLNCRHFFFIFFKSWIVCLTQIIEAKYKRLYYDKTKWQETLNLWYEYYSFISVFGGFLCLGLIDDIYNRNCLDAAPNSVQVLSRVRCTMHASLVKLGPLINKTWYLIQKLKPDTCAERIA